MTELNMDEASLMPSPDPVAGREPAGSHLRKLRRGKQLGLRQAARWVAMTPSRANVRIRWFLRVWCPLFFLWGMWWAAIRVIEHPCAPCVYGEHEGCLAPIGDEGNCCCDIDGWAP